jgi:hypothetical protein
MVYHLSTLNAKRDETAKYFTVVFGHGFYVQYSTQLHLTPPYSTVSEDAGTKARARIFKRLWSPGMDSKE